jgi:hypothetical protein
MRKPIFDAIKAARGGAAFMQEEVGQVDALLDQLGVPVEGKTASAIPDDYWPLLAKIESGNRPYVKAPTSSASGLYQFIRGTWLGEGGKWGSNNGAAFGGLTPSVEEQTARAKSFTEKNVKILQSAGVPINKATLYAAHFLGAGTAKAILAAPNSASAEKMAGPAATAANPSILSGRTVGQFKDWLRKKTGDAA